MNPMCRPADNPFASHRVEALSFRSAGLGWRGLTRRMDDLGGHAAVVGPKGSGKTTLLEELARRLEQPVVVRIPGSCPRPWSTVSAQLPRPVTHLHAILIDGSEQLGAVGWRRLLHATRRARYLIATRHRQGRLPTLIECRTEAGLLRNLVEELAPADTAHLEPRLDELFHRHRGNLRLCFRELYDVYAGRERYRHSGMSCGAAVPAARAGGTPAPQGLAGHLPGVITGG
jgi:hypothetical protein